MSLLMESRKSITSEYTDFQSVEDPAKRLRRKSPRMNPPIKSQSLHVLDLGLEASPIFPQRWNAVKLHPFHPHLPPPVKRQKIRAEKQFPSNIIPVGSLQRSHWEMDSGLQSPLARRSASGSHDLLPWLSQASNTSD